MTKNLSCQTGFRPHLYAPLHGIVISIKHKILAALRLYLMGSYQISVGQEFSFAVGQTSVYKTYAVIMNTCATCICFPRTNAERQLKKTAFLNMWVIGGVISAVDCTHIAILRPKGKGQLYEQERFVFPKYSNYL